MKRRALLGAAAGAFVAFAIPAAAHAMLESAAPRVGATVSAAPPELQLRFSEVVVPSLSRVTLSDSRGVRVALGDLCSAPNSRRVLCAPLPPHLAAGAYRVRWRVVSADSHVTQGEFTFTIQA